MTHIVHKIREWVKARLDENASKKSLPQFYGMMEEDARFLDFLDFSQEEPTTSLWHDARKEEPKPLERYVFVSDMIAPTIQGTFTRPSQAMPWCEYVETYSIVKWAYLDDLLKL